MNISKELNLSKKIVYDITKFTTLDYKDNLACIIWFISCNMRCQYCYNCNIIEAKEGNYLLSDLFSFLEKRVGLLDAVVLSGGEATVHNLIPICKKIKAMGFKIKLDTNGVNFDLIRQLVDENYLDYIALDFKATKDKFKTITSSNSFDEFLKTLKYLLKIKFDFEVRTTLHGDLLQEEDINEIISILFNLGYKKDFYIQNFLNVETYANLGEAKTIFNKNKLSNKLNIIWRN